jgi:hypothetical protein
LAFVAITTRVIVGGCAWHRCRKSTAKKQRSVDPFAFGQGMRLNHADD